MINTYQPDAFIDLHTRRDEFPAGFLKAGYQHFFITKVEEMLCRMKLPVPPSRVSVHTMIYITSGIANMRINGVEYHIEAGEVLLVPAGQVFSFDTLDINTGFYAHLMMSFYITAR